MATNGVSRGSVLETLANRISSKFTETPEGVEVRLRLEVPRCEWKVARVQQLIPSHDEVSRKAHVTSLYKTSIRATCDLFLMFRPSVNVGECNGQH